jgi:hypothetical protein
MLDKMGGVGNLISFPLAHAFSVQCDFGKRVRKPFRKHIYADFAARLFFHTAYGILVRYPFIIPSSLNRPLVTLEQKETFEYATTLKFKSTTTYRVPIQA